MAMICLKDMGLDGRLLPCERGSASPRNASSISDERLSAGIGSRRCSCKIRQLLASLL